MADNALTSEVLSSELGTTGLSQQGGKLSEEWLRKLRGDMGFRTYTEMRDNDATVGALLFAIEMIIRNVEWTVQPDEEVPEDIASKEFVEECLTDMSHTWDDFIAEVLSMLTYGWSYFEKVFKRRSGPTGEVKSQFNDAKIGWRKFSIRGQNTLDRWEFDENGGIQGMWQRALRSQRAYVPIEKALLFRTSIYKNNPEGRSVLRNAYRPWYFKKHIEEIEGVGIERDLAGLPVAKVPVNVLTAKSGKEVEVKNALIKIITNIRRDSQEGVLWPLAYDDDKNPLYELELLSTGGSRQFDTLSIKNGYKQDIAMTVLADFILLGHEKVGSFALSSSKTNIFATALNGWLEMIASVINRFAIPQLLMLNNMPGRCHVSYGDLGVRNLQELGQFIQSLTLSGVLVPDTELENTVRGLANLPQRPDDDLDSDEG